MASLRALVVLVSACGGLQTTNADDAGTDAVAQDARCDSIETIDAGEPIVIASFHDAPATATMAPYGLAVDATFVYWTNYVFDGTVMKCPLGGCNGNVTILAAHQNQPGPLVIDEASVYWVETSNLSQGNQGTVSKCPLSGCSGAPTTLASAQSKPNGIAIDATNIYWTNSGDGTVMQCAIAGCAAPTLLASGQIGPWGIASDGTNVYWANSGGITGSVMKCAVGGCGGTPTTLAAQQAGPNGIAIGGGDVYWTTFGIHADHEQAAIMSCAVGGCTSPTTIFAGPASWAGIAVDATGVYWTQQDTSAGIYAYPFGACPAAQVLAFGQDEPISIAVDAEAVNEFETHAFMTLVTNGSGRGRVDIDG